MELWDLHDRERRPLHRTHMRGEQMAPGEYHLCVEVWTGNSKQQLLLTLRDAGKEDFPNCWENTGGSAISGETSRQAAVRELSEETGIKATQAKLCYLGTIRDETEFRDSHIVRKDLALEQLRMQVGETSAAQWVGGAQLAQMIAAGEIAEPVVESLGRYRARIERFLYQAMS